MASNCIIKSDQFIINSHKESENIINIEPRIFAPRIAPINHIVNLSIPISQSDDDMKEFNISLQETSDKIRSIKSAEDSLDDSRETISTHDIHQFVVMYLVAAGCAAGALWLAWRECRRRRARAARQPGPAPAPATPGPQLTRVLTQHSVSAVSSDKCKAEQSVSVCVKKPNTLSDVNAKTSKATSPVLTKCSFDISDY